VSIGEGSVPKAAWGDFNEGVEVCSFCYNAKSTLQLVKVNTEEKPLYFCTEDPIQEPCAMRLARQLVKVEARLELND
jgi:hypothetical protein